MAINALTRWPVWSLQNPRNQGPGKIKCQTTVSIDRVWFLRNSARGHMPLRAVPLAFGNPGICDRSGADTKGRNQLGLDQIV
jgi:hypothetical protein